jgi:hypothetical protein
MSSVPIFLATSFLMCCVGIESCSFILYTTLICLWIVGWDYTSLDLQAAVRCRLYCPAWRIVPKWLSQYIARCGCTRALITGFVLDLLVLPDNR